MPKTKWDLYSEAWSMPETERKSRLAGVAAANVTYTDPTIALSGLDAFSDHMARFQVDFPGGRFSIKTVSEHHGQSLANWTMIAGDGSEIIQGTSHANLNDEGKFSSFTGFFG